MSTDKQGNTLSGATSACVDLLNQAVEAYNIYRGDPVGLLDQAIEAAPEFAMAYLAKAHLLVTTSEPEATAQARTVVDQAKTLMLNDRERSHAHALTRLLDDGWSAEAEALDDHNVHYPHDILAIQAGHIADFFRGNARNLRDRIARVLPAWSPDMPGYSILLGLHAFGLEECGDYTQAEERGRQATELQPLDCWAHHAVTHVMEMQGRSEDGLGWMIAREPYWSGSDNLFKVHNWWHRALFHLDLGQHEEAVALYDGPLREDRSPYALELVDASSLLWRLYLSGIDVGDRWNELAQAWRPHADGRTYPFNDWHAVMAYLGSGAFADIDRILDEYRNGADTNAETARWAQVCGKPLIEGFVAFWRGDYELSADKLFQTRHIANAFGGSHAQRDVIDWTLTEAAIRSGRKDLARALSNERITLKPHSKTNIAFRSRVNVAAEDKIRAA